MDTVEWEKVENEVSKQGTDHTGPCPWLRTWILFELEKKKDAAEITECNGWFLFVKKIIITSMWELGKNENSEPIRNL